MSEVVIIEALRSPIGRRKGGLAGVHPADLLSRVLGALVERTGIDPAEVGQVVGGCVSQVGEQSFNLTRTAWLTAGLPMETAATTVDTQCGSSQQRAARAWEEDRFAGQVVPIEAPDLDDEGNPLDTTHLVERDEGLRDTSLEALAKLKPVAREDGVHTAGSSSQISDGAAAVLVTTAETAERLGLTPRARVVDTCLVGVDPVLMLTGPIDATRRLLARTGHPIDDIDLFEINEAFASVVLAWAREVGADLERTNPNGGAIALGHPLGATGAFLLTKALHELHRTGGDRALISMCCGGGLGTGTLIERV
jgi:acetyl-CoA C-acetyltransferase